MLGRGVVAVRPGGYVGFPYGIDRCPAAEQLSRHSAGQVTTVGSGPQAGEGRSALARPWVAGKAATVTRQPQEDARPGGHDDGPDVGMPHPARRPLLSTGNPRVTVAFPFSHVEIHEPPDAIRDLAAMVWQLAEQVAVLASQTAPDQAEAADSVAAEAALLARRLGAGS